MGEMAEYYMEMELASFDNRWAFGDEPRYQRNPYRHTCRKCGQGGFAICRKDGWWALRTSRTWHDCPADKF